MICTYKISLVYRIMRKLLFIFVEGPDDRRFFDDIVVARLAKTFQDVRVIEYAGMTKEKLRRLIQASRSNWCDYIFVRDKDRLPCITETKKQITSKYPELDENKILVVERAIEAWYLAGISEDVRRRFLVHSYGTTESIGKYEFNALLVKKSGRRGSVQVSRIEVMKAILEAYSLEQARRLNRSFQYFWLKYCM